MSKKKNYKVEKKSGKLTLHFSMVEDMKSIRRELPPPTRIHEAKKGNGSYSRKEKHKSRRSGNDYGTCFYFISIWQE